MHDLVHDLAQSVAGVECFTVREDSKKHIPQGVRHLCIDDKSFLLEPHETPNLRTLILRSQSDCSVGEIISTLKFLRVLALENYCDNYLPDSLCKLKHLRYLLIESDSITKLPEKITQLQSLQYLNIRCKKLVELPEDLEKMISLRYIWLDSDTQLTYMPRRIGKLVSLQWLSLFVVGKNEIFGSKLNELNGLTNLRDSLTIKNLENVWCTMDTREVNLVGKPKLIKLELVWNEVKEGTTYEGTAFNVLETLEPHGNLKELRIRGYAGARFANWMMLEERLLPNLTRITLSKCRNCRILPSFGQLQFLETLSLEEMDALQFIESTRQGSNLKKSFSSLRELCLRDLPALKGWVRRKGKNRDEPEACLLTRLEKLTVLNCPEMTSMCLVPSLQRLILEGCCHMLIQSILQPFPYQSNPISLPKLRDLTIKYCDDLESLPLRGLTSLEYLQIENCPRLKAFTQEELQDLSSLLELRIIGCECFTTLSAGMRYLTSLEELRLRKLPRLVCLPEEVQKSTKLRYLSIENCEGLISLPDGLGSLTSLQELDIYICPKLESLPDSMQLLANLHLLEICCDGLLCWPHWLGNLKSVTHLWISSSLDHLPKQLQHLTSLQALHIRYCDNLVCLPEWMVNFSLLRRWYIKNCPSLRSLPEQMRELTRLTRLEIKNCDKLTSRCRRRRGQDWYKIAHVPTILLN